MSLGLEISCKVGLLFFNVFSGDLVFDVLPIYELDSWRSELRHYIQNRKDLG